MNFDQAFDKLLGFEGGYSNNSQDPGGETCFGVTRRVALQEGYTGDMHVLPRETAKAIYKKRYWDSIHADAVPEPARYVVFDSAVNAGVTQTARWIERALGVGEDGVLGPVTLSALATADGAKLASTVLGLQLDFKTSLPTWGAFGRGWARRIAAMLTAGTA
jgi:lysozyme family protein